MKLITCNISSSRDNSLSGVSADRFKLKGRISGIYRAMKFNGR